MIRRTGLLNIISFEHASIASHGVDMKRPRDSTKKPSPPCLAKLNLGAPHRRLTSCLPQSLYLRDKFAHEKRPASPKVLLSTCVKSKEGSANVSDKEIDEEID